CVFRPHEPCVWRPASYGDVILDASCWGSNGWCATHTLLLFTWFHGRLSMAGTGSQTTTDVKAVALLIAWISAAQLGFEIPQQLPKSGYNLVVYLTAITGFAVAAGA